MRKFVRWRGEYTDLSLAKLTEFHQGLQDNHGFVAVGAPVRRQFGTDGIAVAAMYEQAIVMLIARNGRVNIQAFIDSNIDFDALKAYAQQVFGLVNHVVVEDEER